MEKRDKKGRFTKGNIPWTKGKPRPKEVKEKLSKSLKESPFSWKGKHHTKKSKRKISLGLKEYYKIHESKNKGKTRPKEIGRKISLAKKGKPLTEEHKRKLLKASPVLTKGWHHTKEDLKKISKASIEQQKICSGPKKHYMKILEESEQLIKNGFRVIPLGLVLPDIIAIKDNRIFAVEVEDHLRNADYYKKYDITNTKKYFDDIIWIIRRERKNDRKN